MTILQEVMGQEIYDLLYTHYDNDGVLIEDMEDVFYCDDNEMKQPNFLLLGVQKKPLNILSIVLIVA